jgi:hypothetical protein
MDALEESAVTEYVGWKDPIGNGLYDMGLTDERIVRCRDCQFGYQHDCKRYPQDKKYMGKWYCIAWGDGMQGEWTREDGFCHRGKPRSES